MSSDSCRFISMENSSRWNENHYLDINRFRMTQTNFIEIRNIYERPPFAIVLEKFNCFTLKPNFHLTTYCKYQVDWNRIFWIFPFSKIYLWLFMNIGTLHLRQKHYRVVTYISFTQMRFHPIATSRSYQGKVSIPC